MLVLPGGTTNCSVGGTYSSTNGIKRKYVPPILIIDTHLINY